MNIHYTMGSYKGQLGRIYVDKLLAVCIEPSTEFIGGDYAKHPINNSGLSETKLKKIRLIDYYGKQMNMAEDDHVYATVQLYIWEVISERIVSSINGDLSLIHYESIKEQINRSITRHDMMPSFHNKTFEVEENTTFELLDTNAVLSQFVVTSSNPEVATLTQSGNKLIIKTHKEGTFELKGQKIDAKDVGDSFSYLKPGLQTLATLKLDDPLNLFVSFTSTTSNGSFELTKLDDQGNVVEGAVFDIGGIKYTTNKNGKILISDLKPQTLTYQETFVPDPLIVDHKTYEVSIEKGKTALVSVENKTATGKITLKKTTEDGNGVEGVRFGIYRNQIEIMQVITNSKGEAQSSALPLGEYEVIELSVPDYLILDQTPRKAVLSYKDQDTPIVYAHIDITNLYRPVATISTSRIRIDTQKAEDGLLVEAWFSKTMHYHDAVNDFKETTVRVEVVNQTYQSIVYSQEYTVLSLPDFDVYQLPSHIQGIDESHHYEVRLSTQESHKVTLEHPSINTLGVTASQQSMFENSQDTPTLYVEGIVRTERYQGQSMLMYFERFEITVPQMDALIAGRGFAYDVTTSYSNDLNKTTQVSLTLMAHNELVDGDWYARTASMAMIPLENKGTMHQVPRVYAYKDISGALINETTYQTLTQQQKEQYRDGGHQILTPLWSSDLGIYHLKLVSDPIGVHEITVTFSDQIELYAYLFGWENDEGPSPTIKSDQVLVSPIYSADANQNGTLDVWEDTPMPDNWGITQKDGSRTLSIAEKQFLDLNN